MAFSHHVMSQVMWCHHVASCFGVMPKGRYYGNNLFVYHMMFSNCITINATITVIMLVNMSINYTSSVDLQLTLNESSWLHVSNWPSSWLFVWAYNFAINPIYGRLLIWAVDTHNKSQLHISNQPSSQLHIWVVNCT